MNAPSPTVTETLAQLGLRLVAGPDYWAQRAAANRCRYQADANFAELRAMIESEVVADRRGVGTIGW